MKLPAFVSSLFIFTLQNRCTDQKFYLPSTVLKQDSFCTECFEEVLVQSHATHVQLICLGNSICPTAMINHFRYTTWMFDEKVANFKHFARQDFCVIVGDKSTHILNFLKRKEVENTGSNGKFVLMFPSPVFGDLSALETLFFAGWVSGKSNIIGVVVSNWRCRVFTYVPIMGRDNYFNSSRPILIDSRTRGSGGTRNDTSVTYFPEKKLSNLNRSSIDVNVEDEYIYWDPFIDFLQVAMNAIFNINHTSRFRGGWPGLDVYPLPHIFVSPLYARISFYSEFVFPPFFDDDTKVYAVPRRWTSTVQWFRLVNELSDFVWFCLIISLMFSIGVMYLFMKSRMDFVSVVLLSVQPLLQHSFSLRFFLWRGRVFFSLWLLSCLVLQSSYLCTLLSKLTVPSTDDAIKSFDDLIKSGLTIYTRTHSYTLARYEDNSPYFKQIKDKLVLIKMDNGKPSEMVQKNRHDIAYLVEKKEGEELFANMSYSFLPEAVYSLSTLPIRMSRPTPYEDIFKMAMMHSLEAGALDKVSRERQHRLFLLSRSSTIQKEKGPKPLPLSSFGALFVVWSLGCLLAFCVFLVELLFGKGFINEL